ncbi:MAG: 3-deoxy-7-phosphoheptulonate synthase [Nitrospirae bacterium]|nr:3-deoxy-7-phosphoheptulonate synthase [Nitrospirota bacterium]MCL5285090.1 3-deoxy-7-phosphoheptulonate synthase [Nitrospirota bacterium]
MIIVMKPEATPQDLERVSDAIKAKGLGVNVSRGKERTVLGAIGDERVLAEVPLGAFPGVESVHKILQPFKLVSREFRKQDTLITFPNGVTIGGPEIQVMAGPCAVESEEQLLYVAERVKKAGAKILRGGAFKPRTSPYTFQGLGEEGLEHLAKAREKTGLLVITELMDPRDLPSMMKYADIIQIGARNMQNFRLLFEVGEVSKPVLLKRGLSATIKEFLMAAEYIASRGNQEIILCERGIRTFETMTRNTLDLNAVPVLKSLTHLPVLVDPSHGTGRWDLVIPMARAGVAAGCDALMVEVHNNPEQAFSDGEESLIPDKFDQLMAEVRRVAAAVGRSVS